MNRLRPNLFVGDYKDPANARLLIENNITAVLNVSYEIDDPLYPPSGVRYVKVGLMDNAHNHEYMKQLAVAILEKMLQEDEIVLVHCAAGLSRSVYVACQAVANLEKADIYRVFQELRNERPFVMQGPLWGSSSNPLNQFYRAQEAEAASQTTE